MSLTLLVNPKSPEVLSPESCTDDELVGLTLRGDSRAFEQLVKRYQSPLFNFLARNIQDSSVAEDTAQETFVQAYFHLASFKRGHPFKSWLFGIGMNQARNYWRKHNRQLDREIQWDDTLNETLSSQEHPASTGEEALSGPTLMLTLQKMDPRYRSALLLRFQEDFTYERIAETLNTPLNTVRTWLRRGKEQLRQHLLQEFLP